MIQRLLCFFISFLVCFESRGFAEKTSPLSIYYSIYSESINFGSLVRNLKLPENLEKESLLWLEHEKIFHRPLPSVTYNSTSDLIHFGPKKSGFEFSLMNRSPLIFRINDRVLQYSGPADPKKIVEYLLSVFGKNKKVSVMKYFLPEASAQFVTDSTPNMWPVMAGVGFLMLATMTPAFFANRAAQAIASNKKELRDYKKSLLEDSKSQRDKSPEAPSDPPDVATESKAVAPQAATPQTTAGSACATVDDATKALIESTISKAEPMGLKLGQCDTTQQEFASSPINSKNKNETLSYYLLFSQESQQTNTPQSIACISTPKKEDSTHDSKSLICTYTLNKKILVESDHKGSKPKDCRKKFTNRKYGVFVENSQLDIDQIRTCCKNECCASELLKKFQPSSAELPPEPSEAPSPAPTETPTGVSQ
jgi:hypothetical protein